MSGDACRMSPFPEVALLTSGSLSAIQYSSMIPGPQKLTVDDARQLTYKATAPVRLTETHIYEICCKRIRQEAAKGALQASCTVPHFAFGLPLYNVRIMRDKVAMRFEREGWSVSCHGQDALSVSWGQAAKSRPPSQRKSAPQQKRNGQAPRVRG